jgi:hypothetical protein
MNISIIVAIVVLSALVYILLKTEPRALRQKKAALHGGHKPAEAKPSLDVELVRSKWTDILSMQQAGPSGLKNALMEADKLLDYVMKARGFAGETMADRLRSGGQSLSNLNAVWEAHKLRNQLAHEVEHDLVAQQVRNALLTYQQAITDLGVRL